MEKCILCSREIEKDSFNTRIMCIRCSCPSCGAYGIQSETERIFGDAPYIEIRQKAASIAAEKKLRRDKTDSGINPGIAFFIHRGRPRETERDYPAFTIEELAAEYPKNPLEMMDRVLLNINNMIIRPGDTIEITSEHKELFFAENDQGIKYILKQFLDNQYIYSRQILYRQEIEIGLPLDIQIEAEGWKRIIELQKKPAGLQNQAFVAMWFDESTKAYFDDGIKKAVENGGRYQAIKIDLVEHNNDIVFEIMAEIRKSKFVVADFTGHRGGVYFEAGFALGLGIPVIWTVHRDHVKQLHFDVSHYNRIEYQSAEELRTKLIARIDGTIV